VYIARRPNEVSIVKHPDPLTFNEERGWSGSHIDMRMVVQDGLYTISPNPTIPFSQGVLKKVIVPWEIKKSLLKTLAKFGTHECSLFPGLATTAKYVEDHFFFMRGIKTKKAVDALLRREFKYRNIPIKEPVLERKVRAKKSSG